jgi:endonuclease/exonuclease/phosphatase family metal-dependent hydrolase
MSKSIKWGVLNGCLILILLGMTGKTVAQELRIMSYNIRYDNPGDGPNSWPNRKDYLIRQVAHYAPDVVGTQEGLIHQLEEMDQGLEKYTFFGVGRDNGGKEGEYSAVFYREDRLELVRQETFWLSETPEKPSKGWDAALNRVCTYGLFRHRQTGQSFYVFNTHFDHIGEQARLESVNLIIEKIKEFNREGVPSILTGDLNLEPESAPIKKLASTLEDTYTHAGDNVYGPVGTFNGFNCDAPQDRRIDYIFTSPGDFEVTGQATLGEVTGSGFPSDHFPVMADLKRKSQ